MIKRCVEISGGPCHISIRDSQLLIRKADEEEHSIPVEDLGVLVIDHPAVTYTHAALCALTAKNAAVVVCGGNHHPAGLLLPVEGHTTQAEAISFQASVRQKLKDRLWKEIVSAKIGNQAFVIKQCGKGSAGLKALSRKVKTGDIGNAEGAAARRYWRLLFGAGFRREREGPPPNGLLNYGYTVLRAAVARAICSSGLHPSLGLHHRNKYNAFALADDLMEPLRPLVDIEAYAIYLEGPLPEKSTRFRLLSVLASIVEINGRNLPMMAALQTYTASLRRIYAGESTCLQMPKPKNPFKFKNEGDDKV